MADPLGCVKEIGKSILWPPLKRHFDYWWCFDDNIQGHKDGVRDLERETFDMNQRIEQARYRAEILRPGVEDWSNAGTKKLAEAKRILQDDNIPKAWNLISRYSMGKNAKQTAEEIAKLRNDGNFITISDPPPPPAMGSAPHRPTMDFKSRKRIEEGIIETLRSSNVGVIGICGMGGVGKTTMVKRIWKRVMEEKLFDEVVMVVVSQQVDMPKIQKEIAKKLGLEIDATADKIHIRLTDTKRKIIIFDDVWKSLELEDLGVSFSSGFDRCKIILTTRSNDICEEMEAQEIFALEVLTEEEAWSLFKERAGDCVEDLSLLSVAKDVAAECKGLPIALVTVGKALHNKNNKLIWEDSLSQLRRSNPIDFKQVEECVYKPLKLSYDSLDSERERRLFLLCCLFPEDYDISVEQLAWYCMGLQMFGEIRSVEETRNRTHTLVEKLKSRFLLFDGRDKHYVKMHDVVRDLAIFIGSEVKHGFLKSMEVAPMYSPRENSSLNCEWMSMSISNEIIDLSLRLHFPNLNLLMMLQSTSDKVSDISFEGMTDLNVLSFSEIEFPSLPRTLGLLKNLRTLHLYCSTVRNISVVGELASLEILSCIECENIDELTAEIGRLKILRFLELSWCGDLQTIPFGVISSLLRLEELKIIGSFRGWEAEEKGKERKNAALTELQSLPNLTRLEIEIDYWNLAAQEICLSQKLVKYCIVISDNFLYRRRSDHEKAIYLNLPINITVGEWIHILVRKTEYLELEEDGSNNFNLGEIQTLRELKLRACSTVKKIDQNVSLCNLTIISIKKCSNLRYLFSVEMARGLLQLEKLSIEECETMEEVFWNENKSITTAASIEFPKLKVLWLVNLPNLTAFCQGVESIHFPNLTEMEIEKLPKLNSLYPLNQKGSNLWKSPNQNASLCNLTFIYIEKCSNLHYLFSVEMAKSLLQLEVLKIEFCETMEEVFWNEIKSVTTAASIEFPKLKTLTLKELPNLTAFCQGVESIHFPNLTKMEIENLPMLNSLCPLNSDDNTSFHFLFNQKGSNLWNTPNHQNASLCKLTSIYIIRCSNLHNLFSVEMARSLLLLEVLVIGRCDTMEEVFWNENKSITSASIEFPKLKELRIRSLPNLTAFCQGIESIHFPNLRVMESAYLPMLNGLCPLNSDEDTSFHFLFNQKGSNLWKTPNHQNASLCNLTSIYMWICSNVCYLFSVEIERSLLQLEVLVIGHCDTMEEVFWNENKSITSASIEFPKLKKLKLYNLPNLTAFCKGVESIHFPNLTEMDIGDLPMLNSLCPLNSDEDTSFHFLFNQKVATGGLKKLTLGELNDNISNIWYHHIPINFFRNLEELTIFKVNGIRNLTSSSIAVNLVSLKRLSINSCQEMVEVIEVEKEAVDLSLFLTLRVLKIENLLKLRSFCQWKQALELSLEDVEIHDCPEMKTFILGSLSTPNIKEFTIDKIKIGDSKDLNGVIHDIWTKSQDKDKNEDEDENDLFEEKKEEEDKNSGEDGKEEEDKNDEVEEE